MVPLGSQRRYPVVGGLQFGPTETYISTRMDPPTSQLPCGVSGTLVEERHVPLPAKETLRVMKAANPPCD